MSNAKNELILNLDYYSSDMYVEEEDSKQVIYIKVFIQVFMGFIVLGILIFSYKYFMKNYYKEVHLWMMEAKVNQVIKKEPLTHNVENEEIVQVITLPVVKPKILHHQELTDEYIKLVEQSLGKY